MKIVTHTAETTYPYNAVSVRAMNENARRTPSPAPNTSGPSSEAPGPPAKLVRQPTHSEMLKEEEQKKTSVAASIRRSALAFQEADEYAGALRSLRYRMLRTGLLTTLALTD